jgi:hypothetical protein
MQSECRRSWSGTLPARGTRRLRVVQVLNGYSAAHESGNRYIAVLHQSFWSIQSAVSLYHRRLVLHDRIAEAQLHVPSR